MIKLVVEFFSKNWQAIIAILGFGISLFNLLYLLKNNRKKIRINEQKKVIARYIYVVDLNYINSGQEYRNENIFVPLCKKYIPY